MAFHLSPASLVDQHGFDYPSLLLLPNASTPSAEQAYANLSLSVPRNVSVPQIFVVNLATDNIFRYVNTESAHAAIIGLIYFSMWLGVLGWDIVSTISFDFRLLRETNWSSRFSSIYSIAYLLSRYVSLSWLITAVTNSVIMTNSCDAWMKGSTALFSVAISATMLVFCLRTCSIWHMKQKVVSLVVSSWLLIVAFALLLPVMSYGNQLPTSNFCAWHFNGLYVVGLFGAFLLFDLLCLVLTVCKLNKAGWRGLLRSLVPSSRFNLDAEDVKIMLVQKTTAFFAIQFLFLISALLVYVLTHTYAYRMMNIVASVAVASSMAGRIFRRAWRQTRELAPHNINRPPSYFPAWTEKHRDPSYSRSDDQCSSDRSSAANNGVNLEPSASKPAHVQRHKDIHDPLGFYIEGEYGPQLRPRSTSTQSLRSLPRTNANGAAVDSIQQMREMEAGHLSANPSSDATGLSPGTIVIGRSKLGVPKYSNTHSISAPHTGPAPAYSQRFGSAATSRPHTSEQDAALSPSQTAGNMFSVRRGSSTPAANNQSRSDTAESQGVSVNDSLVSFFSLKDEVDTRGSAGSKCPDSRSLSVSPKAAGSTLRQGRRVSKSLGSDQNETASDETHGVVMEEKRRTFIASPPLTAVVRLNNKHVYDVDRVKAAARLGGRPLHMSLVRPATASSLSHSPSLGSLGSESSGFQKDDSHRRCNIAGGTGVVETAPFANLPDDAVVQKKGTPRPKTAPSWPSPSLSPSNSVASQMTVRPRDCGALRSRSGITSATQAGSVEGVPALAAEDDVLLAFLQTVDQDSRDRTGSNSPSSISLEDSVHDSESFDEDGRPRTARGTTASSGHSEDTDDGDESEGGTVIAQTSSSRGRCASTPLREAQKAARPRSAKASSRRRSKHVGGTRSRRGTGDSSRSESSNSGARPVTSAGGAVKPFGHGVLGSSAYRRSRPLSSRGEDPTFNSDGDEEHLEPELGSVIQEQYAKLAACAQLPLDPPF